MTQASVASIGTDSKKPHFLTLRGAENLAVALAVGCTTAEAARRAGIRERTVYNRKRDPEFMVYVRTLRAELLERSSGCLSGGTGRAAEVLIELLEDESPTTRLAAARAIFEHAVRVRDAVEVERRLQVIEERLAMVKSNVTEWTGEVAWTR